MAKGSKGEYAYWLTDDGLTLLQGWARDGLTDKQIAQNMGISHGTIYVYKRKYPAITEAIAKGKEVVDYQVENALFKKALSGDVTAMIYWLKNRKPQKWRDRPDVERTDNNGILDSIVQAVKAIE